jgi:peptide/nickel transport system substrate-binding protein
MELHHSSEIEDSHDQHGQQTSSPRQPLSRRAFLRSTVAFGGAFVLAACGAAPPAAEQPTAAPAAPAAPAAEQPTAAPAAPAAEQPTAAPAAEQPTAASAAPAASSDNIYRILSGGDMRSLDPPGAEGSEDWWSAGLVLYNYLYSYDKDGKLFPDLASDMPKISADGKVYTIPLRKGVKFHNGREMTAEDAKFSLEWQLWPDVYSWGKTYVDNIVGYKDVIDGKTKELAGVKVIDPSTIEITLTKPQAVFPAILTMSMNGIIPKQEVIAAGKDFGIKTIIGTGPFKFVEWVAGQHSVYERNPDFFREGLPYLDRIELSLNVDAAVQMLRWENKEVEFIRNIPDAELPRVLSDEAIKAQIRSAQGLVCYRLVPHHQVKPFDDIRVRQAVAHAIDKQAIIQKLSGTVTPIEGYFVPGMIQFDQNFKSKYAYDPDRAKALLAEASLADGIKGVKIFFGTAARDKTVIELIQADLQAIGIETELQPGRLSEYRDKVKAGEFGLYLFSWAASFPDAFDYTSAWVSCAAVETGYNDGKYCNMKIDDLMAKAEGLPLQDPERIAAYREIEETVINQDAAFIGLFSPLGIGLGQPYVKGDDMSPIYDRWPFVEKAKIER